MLLSVYPGATRLTVLVDTLNTHEHDVKELLQASIYYIHTNICIYTYTCVYTYMYMYYCMCICVHIHSYGNLGAERVGLAPLTVLEKSRADWSLHTAQKLF